MNHLVNLYKKKKKEIKKPAGSLIGVAVNLYINSGEVTFQQSWILQYWVWHIALFIWLFNFSQQCFLDFSIELLHVHCVFSNPLLDLWGFTYSSVPSGSGFLICCLVFAVICRSADSVGAPGTLLEVGSSFSNNPEGLRGDMTLVFLTDHITRVHVCL